MFRSINGKLSRMVGHYYFGILSLYFHETEIVVRFGMIVIMHQRQAKALDGMLNIDGVLKTSRTKFFNRIESVNAPEPFHRCYTRFRPVPRPSSLRLVLWRSKRRSYRIVEHGNSRGQYCSTLPLWTHPFAEDVDRTSGRSPVVHYRNGSPQCRQ